MACVRNPRRFRRGLLGLATFLAALSFWVFPLINGRTGLEQADELFNQLAKHSVYFMPEAARTAAKFRGVPVDLGVNPRWPGGDARVARILQDNGISATVVGDARVRIVGDLGRLANAAVADADLLFTGEERALETRYGMTGKEVIYYWWATFEGLGRRYVQENRAAEAELARYVATRVLEPSYNFAGIRAKSISETFVTVVWLLSFYVVYTLWLGFSIMWLFEGLGITMTKPAEKREA